MMAVDRRWVGQRLSAGSPVLIEMQQTPAFRADLTNGRFRDCPDWPRMTEIGAEQADRSRTIVGGVDPFVASRFANGFDEPSQVLPATRPAAIAHQHKKGWANNR
jgi:hypothetical protein